MWVLKKKGKQMIKVVVHKPRTNEWYEAEIDSYKDYYEHLECTTFDVVRLGRNLSIYVDDEGLMIPNPYMSQVKGFSNLLAGNLVFTGGTDDEGETLSCPLTLEALKRKVKLFSGGF